VDILLVEQLAPEARAWLEGLHSVESRSDLAGDPSALRKAIYKAQALVLPRKVAVTREFLDFAPLLKAVARVHVGTDNTDLEACHDRRVRVIQASTANVRSNAEYLLAALLLLYRRGMASSLSGERHAEVRIGRELNGSVVGILGLAPTAHTFALMLHALGAKLIGYDPAVHHTAPIWSRLHVRPVTLQEVMMHSDAVSVQVMYGSRYQNFINDKVLAHCKHGQVWAVISRSQLIDANAMAQALSDGRIEACIMDGAEAGFAAKGSPLHDLPNMMITPRLGSYTREARLRSSWYVAHRIHETLTSPQVSGLDQLSSHPMDLQTGPSSGAGDLG
jgi:phosphoglycerate dehydrogenase-like enzyme